MTSIGLFLTYDSNVSAMEKYLHVLHSNLFYIRQRRGRTEKIPVCHVFELMSHLTEIWASWKITVIPYIRPCVTFLGDMDALKKYLYAIYGVQLIQKYLHIYKRFLRTMRSNSEVYFFELSVLTLQKEKKTLPNNRIHITWGLRTTDAVTKVDNTCNTKRK